MLTRRLIILMGVCFLFFSVFSGGSLHAQENPPAYEVITAENLDRLERVHTIQSRQFREVAWLDENRLLALRVWEVVLYDANDLSLPGQVLLNAGDVTTEVPGGLVVNSDLHYAAAYRLASHDSDGNFLEVHPIDLTTLTPLPTLQIDPPGSWETASFLGDTPYLAVETSETTEFWNVTTGQQIAKVDALANTNDFLITVTCLESAGWDCANSQILLESAQTTITLERPITVLQAHLSPDQQYLALLVRQADGFAGLEIWEMATQSLHQTFALDYDIVTDVKFHPTESWVITNSGLWDFHTGERVQGGAFGVGRAAFDPTGTKIAFASGFQGTGLKIFDTATLTVQQEVPPGHDHVITAVVASPDGKWVASTGWDGQLMIWDTQDWSTHCQVRLPVQGNDLTFTNDSSGLILARDDRIAEIWNPTTCEKTTEFPVADSSLNTVTTTPDGEILFSGSDGVWWGADFGYEQVLLYPHTAREVTVVQDALGQQWIIYVTDGNGIVLLRRLDGSVEESFFPEGTFFYSGTIQELATSADGRYLAAASSGGPTGGEGGVTLWDVHDNFREVLRTENSLTRRVAFNPDGTLLVSSLVREGQVVFWDTTSGAELARLDTASGMTRCFTADGRFMITATNSTGRIEIWGVPAE